MRSSILLLVLPALAAAAASDVFHLDTQDDDLYTIDNTAVEKRSVGEAFNLDAEDDDLYTIDGSDEENSVEKRAPQPQGDGIVWSTVGSGGFRTMAPPPAATGTFVSSTAATARVGTTGIPSVTVSGSLATGLITGTATPVPGSVSVTSGARNSTMTAATTTSGRFSNATTTTSSSVTLITSTTALRNASAPTSAAPQTSTSRAAAPGRVAHGVPSIGGDGVVGAVSLLGMFGMGLAALGLF
jgi:hypothetical protein